jgi:hypothetical protein
VDKVASHFIEILRNGGYRKSLDENGREWRDKARQLEQVNMSIFNKANTLDPSNP